MGHTPGPWHANAIRAGFIIGDENTLGYEEIQVCSLNVTVATVYRRADATLIKTAPKMAEALQALVTTIEATGGVIRDADGKSYPAGDEEWQDLADAYEMACAALGREPKEVPGLSSEELEESEDE